MSQIKVTFFTEAGSKRGMGHLVRLYTIYEEFVANKIESVFFLDSDVNYDYKFSNIHYFTWNTFTLHKKYDIIFIDSYEANINIYKEITNSTKVGVYIDDYARLEYPKGVIINFAPDAKELFYPNEKKQYHYLLGLDYLPLRKAITKTTQKRKEEQIFIMLGGADTKNLTLSIIHQLTLLNINKVVVSNNLEVADKLKQYEGVAVLFQPSDTELVKAMSKSTMAITTASMSVYELYYLNTPSIIVSTAQNQTIGIKQFLKHQLTAFYVDIKCSNWCEEIEHYAKKLITSKSIIPNKQQIDGNGTIRIINKVLELCKKS